MFDLLIICFVKEESLAHPVIKSLNSSDKNNFVKVIIGKEPSFAKTVNKIIYEHQHYDKLILCSHRVRPSSSDIDLMVDKINKGYGLVTLYRLAMFGFKTDLFSKIKLFDEDYIIGGYEDNDLYLRLQLANISYYEKEDPNVGYIKSESTWKHPPGELKSKVYFDKKWTFDQTNKIITKNCGENTSYTITQKSQFVFFKDWSHSELTTFSSWQNQFLSFSDNSQLHNESILIIGGTGSLGYKLINKYAQNNTVIVVSRDELKQSVLKQQLFNCCNKDVKFFLGDIRDIYKMTSLILFIKPSIIIIASALKHIDSVEYDVYEALQTNTIGIMNICNIVSNNITSLHSLKKLLYISTDKSCNPQTVYGMTKSLSERIIIEYSLKLPSIDFYNCRYGNVLDSRGSIIPKLKEIANDNTCPAFYLTNDNMTRFIMTQDEAVNLIDFTLIKCSSGQTCIPKLKSIKIKDLLELFSKKYNKPIKYIGLRGIEKFHELLLNEDEINRSFENGLYYVLQPSFFKNQSLENSVASFNTIYSSENTLISKQDLSLYLSKLHLM
jgi:nucleoside-diphosphate-sugar epimerase